MADYNSPRIKEILQTLGQGKIVLTYTAKEKEFYAKGHMRHDEGYRDRHLQNDLQPLTIEEMERVTEEFLNEFK